MRQESSALAQRCFAALNRITKWRSVFAGWQLGSRLKGDPECDAVRDHREISILQRVEVSALKQVLVQAGAFTEEEFGEAYAQTWDANLEPGEPGDGPDAAVREHRAVTIGMRVELSALTWLLQNKGIYTPEEFQEVMITEVDLLETDYEQRFPGMRATHEGIQYDKRAIKTMKNWKY
jgi:hypothetical protein